MIFPLTRCLFPIGALLAFVIGVTVLISADAACQDRLDDPITEESYRASAQVAQNPSQFVNQVVTVLGRMVQRVDQPEGDVQLYVLRDFDSGRNIYVRTTQGIPVRDQRFRVQGVMTRGLVSGVPSGVAYFIDENGRRQIEGADLERPSVDTTRGVIGQGLPDTDNPQPEDSDAVDRPDESNTSTYLLIALAALVLLGLGFLLVRVLRGSGEPTGTGITPLPEPPIETPPPAEPGLPSEDIAPGEASIIEDRTIKLHRPTNDRTVKVLPGRFKVNEGLTDIPELRFFMPRGRNTAEITFGRATGRPYEHIQLKPRTVSSRQAKLVFDGGAYTLINHASKDSNPTTINGRDLREGEEVTLKDGDRIGMGEVMFEYQAQ